MFRRYFLFFATLVFSGNVLQSQDKTNTGNYDNGTTLNVLYRSDKTGKIYATTRGFGFLFRQGRHVNAKTRSYYELDIQTLKHPKEKKVQGDADVRRRYVYGKIHSVLLLRGALGLQNVIFAKADNKAVEVRYSYSLGPVLALAKPYYLDVFRNNNNRRPEMINFGEENWTADSGDISGRSPFSEGMEEMKFFPGVTGKFNLSFEYAPYTNIIRAIETGISLDYFPKALPLMARNPAENFVVTLHVGFVFGRKWF